MPGAPFLLAIMGATATGKTALAEAIAESQGARLINADAFQIYRGMDIGTAKPERRDRYALIDVKNPDESFGVGEWVALGCEELRSIHNRGQSAVVVGGTGLYVRALFEGYTEMADAPDSELRAQIERREREEGLPALAQELTARAPEVASRTDLQNPARVRRALERLDGKPTRLAFDLPPFRQIKVAIDLPKEDLETRIVARIAAMVQNGWVAEVRNLRDAGYQPEHPGFRALGYRSMAKVLAGEIELDEAIATTIAETRRYAKRQRTWLRSEPRLAVIGLDLGAADPYGDARAHIEALIECKE